MREGSSIVRHGRLVTALLLAVSVSGACGEPGFVSFVINHADHAYVLRYEPSETGNSIIPVTIPALSTGVGLGGMEWAHWRGTVAVMTTDCRLLGRVEIKSDRSLVEIEADGSFSLTTEGIDQRNDTNVGTVFTKTPNCMS